MRVCTTHAWVHAVHSCTNARHDQLAISSAPHSALPPTSKAAGSCAPARGPGYESRGARAVAGLGLKGCWEGAEALHLGWGGLHSMRGPSCDAAAPTSRQASQRLPQRHTVRQARSLCPPPALSTTQRALLVPSWLVHAATWLTRPPPFALEVCLHALAQGPGERWARLQPLPSTLDAPEAWHTARALGVQVANARLQLPTVAHTASPPAAPHPCVTATPALHQHCRRWLPMCMSLHTPQSPGHLGTHGMVQPRGSGVAPWQAPPGPIALLVKSAAD